MPDGCSKPTKCSEEARCLGKEGFREGSNVCRRYIEWEDSKKSVMIDTGATHNFVYEVEAKSFGLKLEKDVGRMKAVNSRALAITELAKQLRVKIDT